MAIEFKNDWQKILKDEFQKDYYKELRKKLVYEYKHYKIYPDMYDLFNALHYTSYEDTKICIIGQDPYHGEGQAHGLSFSVREGVQPPPSLLNIYKEMEDDLGIKPPKTGCLIPWAKQGVLLLNAVLTVRANSAASHRSLGWEEFTDRIIELLNEREKPLVFILWGNFAISKKELITNPNHLILTSPHPSPLSANRGFFGSKPFSKANAFLEQTGQTPIDFSLE
ncbi:uracil-DNA glycosylase [uncultured Anaerofustis sp.]|uniref:uracil-DNA glycosylase n=1 Tax=uncultured Anaerofustis sp. TaxID=904996 RepID=UPI0025F81C2B|nr:uracil-DNA glycosylase [uncultured Anaerofustis sp.]